MSKVPVRVRSPSTDLNDASVAGEPPAQASRSARADVGGQDSEIQETIVKPEAGEESLDVWRDRALRLQAEIENFRKRQRRLAEQQIATEREQLPCQISGPLSGALDLLHVCAPWIVGCHILKQDLGVPNDGEQQVVEIVGYPPRQAPDGLHLLRLPQLRL